MKSFLALHEYLSFFAPIREVGMQANIKKALSHVEEGGEMGVNLKSLLKS